MFAFDIDGTLLNSVHEATDATCEALRKLASAGIRVVLATGRRYRDALPLADMFQIELPLVTASGGSGEISWRSFHPIHRQVFRRRTRGTFVHLSRKDMSLLPTQTAISKGLIFTVDRLMYPSARKVE